MFLVSRPLFHVSLLCSLFPALCSKSPSPFLPHSPSQTAEDRMGGGEEEIMCTRLSFFCAGRVVNLSSEVDESSSSWSSSLSLEDDSGSVLFCCRCLSRASFISYLRVVTKFSFSFLCVLNNDKKNTDSHFRSSL